MIMEGSIKITGFSRTKQMYTDIVNSLLNQPDLPFNQLTYIHLNADDISMGFRRKIKE